MGDDGSLVQASNLDMFARLNPYAHRSGLASQPGAALHPLASYPLSIAEGGVKPAQLGFMWNDYTLVESEPSSFRSNRGLKASKAFTSQYLGENLLAVFRAHQHDGDTIPLIKKAGGVLPHWQQINGDFSGSKIEKGTVLTFAPGADTPYLNNAGLQKDYIGYIEISGPIHGWTLDILKDSLL